MRLKSILKNCKTKFFTKINNDVNINGICTNSKNIKNNFIFGAIRGNNFNGEDFIKDFKKFKNLIVIISTKSKYNIDKLNKNISIIKTDDVRKLVSEISYLFFPSFLKEKVAITGTNGKTSVSHFVRQIWIKKNIDCCSIGTLGVFHNNKKIFKTHLTTLDSIDFNRHLRYLTKKGCERLVLEASSIGLDQNRLFPTKFEKVVFTNLSRDHLDYHKTLTSYKNSKILLFKNHTKKNSIGVINSDSKFSKFFYETCYKQKIKVLDFGKKAKFVKILKLKKFKDFFKLYISINKKKFDFELKSISEFEIYNKICALLIVHGESLNKEDFNILNKISSPSGRIEKIRNKKNLNIFVDYAHTPDAVKNVLSSLRKDCSGNIITVIGCGGERDKTKRPLMTKEALKLSHKVIITDDNPRNEDPQVIRKEMKMELTKNEKKKIKEIPNRKKAIQYSISILKKNDYLLIAGKGHENYQIIKNKKINFSDKKEAIKFVNKK